MSKVEYGVRWHGQTVVTVDGSGTPYSREDVLQRQAKYESAVAVSRTITDWQPIDDLELKDKQPQREQLRLLTDDSAYSCASCGAPIVRGKRCGNCGCGWLVAVDNLET